MSTQWLYLDHAGSDHAAAMAGRQTGAHPESGCLSRDHLEQLGHGVNGNINRDVQVVCPNLLGQALSTLPGFGAAVDGAHVHGQENAAGQILS